MEDFAIWGTLVNVGGVLLGSCLGLGIRALGRLRRSPVKATDAPSDESSFFSAA